MGEQEVNRNKKKQENIPTRFHSLATDDVGTGAVHDDLFQLCDAAR